MEKLIRDKIPEIMKLKGQNPIIKIIETDKQYFFFLKEKLLEEANELIEACHLKSKNKAEEEIADILEVIETLIDFKKLNVQEVLNKKKLKKKSRGGFSKRILLLSKDLKNV
jgi:predicted house-cleaning noncanonical NTP pyrophosphatase (MazG superfamily)